MGGERLSCILIHLHIQKNSVPNAGLNLLRPDIGCPLRAGTGHGGHQAGLVIHQYQLAFLGV